MEHVIDEVVAKTAAVIDAVAAGLPRKFPAELFERVTSGLQNAASQMAKMRATAAIGSRRR